MEAWELNSLHSASLAQVIEYLYFKYKYTDAKVPCSILFLSVVRASRTATDREASAVFFGTLQVPIPEFPIDDDVVLEPRQQSYQYRGALIVHIRNRGLGARIQILTRQLYARRNFDSQYGHKTTQDLLLVANYLNLY